MSTTQDTPTLRHDGRTYVYADGEWFARTYPGAAGTIILDGVEPSYDLVTDPDLCERLDRVGAADATFLAALNAVR